MQALTTHLYYEPRLRVRSDLSQRYTEVVLKSRHPPGVFLHKAVLFLRQAENSPSIMDMMVVPGGGGGVTRVDANTMAVDVVSSTIEEFLAWDPSIIRFASNVMPRGEGFKVDLAVYCRGAKSCDPVVYGLLYPHDTKLAALVGAMAFMSYVSTTGEVKRTPIPWAGRMCPDKRWRFALPTDETNICIEVFIPYTIPPDTRRLTLNTRLVIGGIACIVYDDSTIWHSTAAAEKTEMKQLEEEVLGVEMHNSSGSAYVTYHAAVVECVTGMRSLRLLESEDVCFEDVESGARFARKADAKRWLGRKMETVAFTIAA